MKRSAYNDAKVKKVFRTISDEEFDKVLNFWSSAFWDDDKKSLISLKKWCKEKGLTFRAVWDWMITD